MKPLITLFGLMVICLSMLHAQEEIEVHISGVVRDTVQDIVVTDFKIALQYEHTTIEFSSEDDSIFVMSTSVPKERLSFYLTVSGPEISSNDILIDTIATTELHLKLDLLVQPRSICSDSFRPGYIHFDENKIDPKPADLQLIDLWAEKAAADEHGIFRDSLIIITAYSSISEEKVLAEKRAERVKSILIRHGIPEKDIELQIRGHQAFTYYPYREGCHYYYLKGAEIDLSHEAIQNVDSLQQLKFNSLRRLIEVR